MIIKTDKDKYKNELKKIIDNYNIKEDDEKILTSLCERIFNRRYNLQINAMKFETFMINKLGKDVLIQFVSKKDKYETNKLTEYEKSKLKVNIHIMQDKKQDEISALKEILGKYNVMNTDCELFFREIISVYNEILNRMKKTMEMEIFVLNELGIKALKEFCETQNGMIISYFENYNQIDKRHQHNTLNTKIINRQQDDEDDL